MLCCPPGDFPGDFHIFYICTCSMLAPFWNTRQFPRSFQLVSFPLFVQSITIAGLWYWHNRKRKSYSRYAKSQVPYVLTSCVSIRSVYILLPSRETHSNAFKTLKNLFGVLSFALLSVMRMWTIPFLSGWLIGGNLKKKTNNRGACFTFHQSNENKKERDWPFPSFLSHSSLLSFLHPIFVCFSPVGNNFKPPFQSS